MVIVDNCHSQVMVNIAANCYVVPLCRNLFGWL